MSISDRGRIASRGRVITAIVAALTVALVSVALRVQAEDAIVLVEGVEAEQAQHDESLSPEPASSEAAVAVDGQDLAEAADAAIDADAPSKDAGAGEGRQSGVILYRDKQGTLCYPVIKDPIMDTAQLAHNVWYGGWYYASEDLSFDERVTISGDVRLIIGDGVKITLRGGIHLTGGNKLSIFGQEDGNGSLTIDHSNVKDEAGIGGNSGEAGGDLTICGGVISSQGGEDAAGIGGGCDGAGGTVEVFGGDVTATGNEYGAGIGGGRNGDGGSFAIHGGHVVAKGGGYDALLVTGGSAGIGGGDSANGGSVVVYGGDLEVNGGYMAACIGGGDGGNGGAFTMEGGKVHTYPHYAGAGIGGGNKGNGGEVRILGGEVEAHGGSCGAGIGGGRGGKGGTVFIQDAKVNAWTQGVAAGIGGGSDGAGGGEVSIINATVSATGESGAGIGGGYDGGAACAKVTIEGSTVTASSRGGGAAIGGGCEGSGVFGGAGGNGGKVVIRDSKVTAVSEGGSTSGSAIGGGGKASGGEVIIEGNSTVDAASTSGAAIGRGEGGPDSGVGTVKMSDDLCVVSCDDNDAVTSVDLRQEYCRYRHHVRIEPCAHDGASYERARAGHVIHCPHCLVDRSGAKTHSFGNNGTCSVCGYNATRPQFVRVTPATTGQLGITFWYQFPDDECVDFSASEVTLSIDGKGARELKLAYADAEQDARGLRGFTMPLSTVELGQTVSARVCFGEDEQVAKEAALADVMIGAALLEDPECAASPAGKALSDLADAQANYGHYIQAFVAQAGACKLGKDYKTSDICFPRALDVEGARKALAGYKSMKRGPHKDGVRVSMSATFGSTVTLDLVITPAPGCKLSKVLAGFAGQLCETRQLDDGRWLVRVSGVKPQDFCKAVSVSGKSSDTVQAFRIDTSLYAYANALMASGKYGSACDEAMASMYRYSECMKAYDEALQS